MQDLQERIERLERSTRRAWCAFAILIGAGVAAAFAAAAPGPTETVIARRLVIVSDGGDTIATLGGRRAGKGGSLTVFDDRGRERVRIAAGREDVTAWTSVNTAGIEILDSAASPAVQLYDMAGDHRGLRIWSDGGTYYETITAPQSSGGIETGVYRDHSDRWGKQAGKPVWRFP
jgi:hypothetical protein